MARELRPRQELAGTPRDLQIHRQEAVMEESCDRLNPAIQLIGLPVRSLFGEAGSAVLKFAERDDAHVAAFTEIFDPISNPMPVRRSDG
jgi:hypothetical protein